MKHWQIAFAMKTEDGGTSEGGWMIRTWTALEAIGELVAILKKTSKDPKARGVKSLSVQLILK